MVDETDTLFKDLPEGGARRECAPSVNSAARVLMPNRDQIELRPSDLESLLPEGHRARIVWGYVQRQELSGLYAGIKAREGGSGRTTIAPLRFCLRCGCTPRLKAWAAPGRWNV